MLDLQEQQLEQKIKLKPALRSLAVICENCQKTCAARRNDLLVLETCVLREAFTKKNRSNLGKSPNREGGRSTSLNPIPNLLTDFSKNAKNAQKHIINTEQFFHL